MTEYNFELAFSLLDKDLGIAKELKTHLGGGDDIFLYSDHEKILKFNSGVVELGKIYKTGSRFIVVLHRKEYGGTEFTNLENLVIRDRFFKLNKGKSPGNILFIKLDDSPLPEWVPSEYIFEKPDLLNLKRTANFIRIKLDEVGGNLKEVTAVEEALEIQRRDAWLQSIDDRSRTNEARILGNKEALILACSSRNQHC